MKLKLDYNRRPYFLEYGFDDKFEVYGIYYKIGDLLTKRQSTLVSKFYRTKNFILSDDVCDYIYNDTKHNWKKGFIDKLKRRHVDFKKWSKTHVVDNNTAVILYELDDILPSKSKNNQPKSLRQILSNGNITYISTRMIDTAYFCLSEQCYADIRQLYSTDLTPTALKYYNAKKDNDYLSKNNELIFHGDYQDIAILNLDSSRNFPKFPHIPLKDIIDRQEYTYIFWCLENLKWFAVSEEVFDYIEEVEETTIPKYFKFINHSKVVQYELENSVGPDDDEGYYSDNFSISAKDDYFNMYNDDLDMDQQSPEFWNQF